MMITELFHFSGKDEPKAPSMHIKPKDPKSFVTPAPGAYNPENAVDDVKRTAPKYSFGIKGKDEKPAEVPGMTGSKLKPGLDALRSKLNVSV